MSWQALIVLALLYWLYSDEWNKRSMARHRKISRRRHRKSRYYANKSEQPIRTRNEGL